MNQDSQFYIMIASLALMTMTILAYSAMRIWNEWMAFKREELQQHLKDDNNPAQPSTMSRIEVADLKERVRKLEAIAAGIDL